MKKITAILMILCVICFVGCAKKDMPIEETFRYDAEGLVIVRIVGGEAMLSFDSAQWENLHNISAKSHYFAIQNLNGKVKDACIGKIESLSHDDVWPTVVLLMEDGRLEWLLANPTMPEFYSMGRLPWLKDIVSLSYEVEAEGIGEATIYAIGSDGLKYDVRTLCDLTTVFDAEWVCEVGDNNSIFLTLSEVGNFSIEKGMLDGERSEFCKGKYTVYLAENNPSGQRPGIIAFEAPTLNGEYFMEADGFDFTLYLSGGDTLEIGAALYPFWQPAMHTGVVDGE